jgi:regulatory protein
MQAATRALARRDRSSAELERHLGERGVGAPERVRTVEALERGGYVDDARFAATRAEALANRDYGDAGIAADLECRGVAVDDIAAAIASQPSEHERARRHVQRHGATPKTARRLAARGFAPESIEAALDSAGVPAD